MLTLVAAVSFFASFAINLLFRRIGKFSNSEKKLTQHGKLLEQILQQEGGKSIQNIKDGILEYKTLYNRGHEQRKQIEKVNEDCQKNIQRLEKDRIFINQIAQELNEILGQTKKIGNEVSILDQGLEKISQARDFMHEIEERIGNIEENLVVQTEKTQTVFENLNQQALREQETIQKTRTEMDDSLQITKDQLRQALEKNEQTLRGNMENVIQNYIEVFQNEIQREKISLLEIVNESRAKDKEDRSDNEDWFTEQKKSIQEHISENHASLIQEAEKLLNRFTSQLENHTQALFQNQKKRWQDFSELDLDRLENQLAEITNDNQKELNSQQRAIQENFVQLQQENEKTQNLTQQTEKFSERIIRTLQENERQFVQLNQDFATSLTEGNESLKINKKELEHWCKEALIHRQELPKIISNNTQLVKENFEQLQKKIKDHNLLKQWKSIIVDLEQKIVDSNRELETGIEERRESLEEKLNAKIKKIEATFHSSLAEYSKLLDKEKEKFKHHLEESILLSNRKIKKLTANDVKAEFTDLFTTILKDRVENISEELDDQMKKQYNQIEVINSEKQKGMAKTYEQGLSQIREASLKITQEGNDYLGNLQLLEKDIQEKIHQWRNEKIQADQEQSTLTQYLKDASAQCEKDLFAKIEMRFNEKGIVENAENKISKMSHSLVTKYLEKFTNIVQENHKQAKNKAHQLEQELEEVIRIGGNQIEKQRIDLAEALNKSQEVQEKIANFEKKIPLLKKASILSEKLNSTVLVLTEKLEIAQRENNKFEQIYQDYESIRDQHHDIEGNIALLNQEYERFKKKEKIIKQLDQKLNRIDEAKDLSKDLQQRIEQMNRWKQEYDSHMAQVESGKDKLEQIVHSFQTSKKNAREVMKLATQANETFEKFRFRQEEITKNISHLEKRSNHLQKLENNILKVESRFEQMDTLLVDLEEKQKQTVMMGSSFTQHQKKCDELMRELSSLISEAEEKMDRLTAFYDLVDKMKNMESDLTGSDLSPEKKENILTLYKDHHWDEGLIAEKLKVEPSIVRTIIASKRH